MIGLDDRDGAVKEYATYLKQQPDDAQGHLNLAAIYIGLRRFDMALPHYERACEIAPDANTLTDLGTLYAKTSKLPEAIKAFQKALELDPANEIARKNLAQATSSSQSPSPHAP